MHHVKTLRLVGGDTATTANRLCTGSKVGATLRSTLPERHSKRQVSAKQRAAASAAKKLIHGARLSPNDQLS
jgi:hypothetical protein